MHNSLIIDFHSRNIPIFGRQKKRMQSITWGVKYGGMCSVMITKKSTILNWLALDSKKTVCLLGLQRYTGVPVHPDIFCHNTNIVYWTSYHDIYDTFTYASTNMGKHCLQLVLTLLLLFSACAWRFSEQTDEKNPCWAVFSVIFTTRLVSRTDFWAHEQHTRQYPSCFVVT